MLLWLATWKTPRTQKPPGGEHYVWNVNQRKMCKMFSLNLSQKLVLFSSSQTLRLLVFNQAETITTRVIFIWKRSTLKMTLISRQFGKILPTQPSRKMLLYSPCLLWLGINLGIVKKSSPIQYQAMGRWLSAVWWWCTAQCLTQNTKGL